jgi:hypothetical protein
MVVTEQFQLLQGIIARATDDIKQDGRVKILAATSDTYMEMRRRGATRVTGYGNHFTGHYNGTFPD